MENSCEIKQKAIIELFRGCSTASERYQKIIELGKSQTKLDAVYKTEENRVQGCQSRMYLHTRFENGRLYFETESDALISAGLAELLTRVYSGEAPEVILTQPATYIEELGIKETLTPGRSSGLGSLYLRMKQEALKYYMEQNRG